MARILWRLELPPDDEKWGERACGKCNTYFEFQKKEVRTTKSFWYGLRYEIDCPYCGRTLNAGWVNFAYKPEQIVDIKP